MTPRQLFGEIAIRRGHTTPPQLDRALKIQKQLRKRGEKKLIGMVMLERGMITNDQLIDILRCIEILKTAAPGIMPSGHQKDYRPRPAI